MVSASRMFFPPPGRRLMSPPIDPPMPGERTRPPHARAFREEPADIDGRVALVRLGNPALNMSPAKWNRVSWKVWKGGIRNKYGLTGLRRSE